VVATRAGGGGDAGGAGALLARAGEALATRAAEALAIRAATVWQRMTAAKDFGSLPASR
jgi:hypothetical protein